MRRSPSRADHLAPLRGRTAVVTGASSGIGAAFCRQLAAEGLRVVGVARRADALQAVAREVRGAGGEADVVVADLASPADRARVGARLEGPDVGLLVNAAGVAHHGPVAEVGLDEALAMVEVDVAAVVDLTKRAVDAFLRDGRRGAVVNVASTAAYKPMPGLTVYGSAKAFVRELSRSLDREVRRQGVEVCVVSPGPVRTPMLEAALGRPIAPPGRFGRLLERVYFMDADECVRRALAGFRAGRPEVVVDPVDRAVVRLPRSAIERIDRWSLRHLTGGTG